jgi:hypothetical protein
MRSSAYYYCDREIGVRSRADVLIGGDFGGGVEIGLEPDLLRGLILFCSSSK